MVVHKRYLFLTMEFSRDRKLIIDLKKALNRKAESGARATRKVFEN